MEIQLEINELNYERELIENINNDLDELWLLTVDKIEYLSWLQGILTLCRTGK